ncbi:hypothetical protein FNV43_RR09180 [Rhamnella rubrinervis]|uniref:Protein kinase domain-containing protein n=1 Tax=Rhamnella rubrinervis TaxID=2594499 RepID=A0A8K0H9M7_9ROSA|nr:hypothetical protein FNV43_RR09180 [Rhamnella rubrinervis]
MDYKQYGSGWWWLILLSTTFINLLQQHQFAAHEISNNKHHHHYGPPTNVTKTLHFPNFTPNDSTLIHHDQVKLLGNAGISKDKGVIQIPDASQAVDCTYQVGRALYSSPIRLFDPLTLTPASFQTTFSFQLDATTTNNSSSGGGGLAFVIVPDEFTIGRPGPWLGILNDACKHYNVFAVEFDTSHDPELGDPNDDHVGINVGAIVSFKTANSSGARISLHSNSRHRAWITYDGHRRWIDVHLGSDSDPIHTQPILSSPLNLSPFLEEYMFVGFSASTGNSTQIHNIISWNFSSTAQAFLQLPSTEVCRRNIHNQVSKYSTISHYNKTSSFLVFVAVLGLCSVALLSFYFSSQPKESSISLLLTEKKQRPMPPGKPRRFTVPELHKATRGFSNVQVLTSDSGGVLYRGILSNGCCVAVKRYFSTQSLTRSTTRLYWSRDLKRIGQLTQISHPSLSPIRGWCCDGRETIVVYDYYQFGSMDTWLLGVSALPWTRRSQLIKDVAEALSYLHSKELAHGNVKTSSVFFDANYRAVLGDYGFILSQRGEEEPKLDKKEDVFWFGMFVMEIVATKKGIEEGGEQGVLGLVRKMHERREMVKVVDEKMGDYVNFEEEAVQVLKMGLNCTATDVNVRPCMEEVLHFFNMQSLSLNRRALPWQRI